MISFLYGCIYFFGFLCYNSIEFPGNCIQICYINNSQIPVESKDLEIKLQQKRQKCTMKNTTTLNETVREALGIALFQIMETKSFHTITISEIASVAGVSRNSFYRNYSGKDDLLIKYLSTLYWDFYQTEILPHHKADSTNISEFLIPRFRFIKDHSNLYRTLHKQNLLYYFFQQTEDHLIELMCGEEPMLSPCHRAMLSGACAGTVRYWIENDFKESEEAMANHFAFLFYHTGSRQK